MSLLLTVTNKEEPGPFLFFLKTLGLRIFVHGVVGTILCVMLPLLLQSAILNSTWGESVINQIFAASDEGFMIVMGSVGPLLIFIAPLLVIYAIISTMLSIWLSAMSVVFLLILTICIPVVLENIAVDYVLRKTELAGMVRRNYLLSFLWQVKKWVMFLIHCIIAGVITFLALVPGWLECGENCDITRILMEMIMENPRGFMILSMKSGTVTLFLASFLQTIFVSFNDMLHVPRPDVLTPVQHWIKSLKSEQENLLETEMKELIIEEFEDPVAKQQREEAQLLQQKQILEALGGTKL